MKMFSQERMIMVVGLCFFVFVGNANANGERLLPPLFKQKIDFDGHRYIDRDDSGFFRGLKSDVFKKKIRLILEPNPFAHGRIQGYPKLSGVKWILLKEPHDEKKTLVKKQVRSLADLQGSAKINTESDALEFVRIASSRFAHIYFDTPVEEVFCVDDIDTSSRSLLASHADCLALGFGPVEVKKGPHHNKKNRNKHSERNDDANEQDDENGAESEGENFFIIKRVLYSYKHNGFFRTTEEVGPAGQWRVLSEEFIAKRNSQTERIFNRIYTEILKQSKK